MNMLFWQALNGRAKLCYVLTLINLGLAFVLAYNGLMVAIFHALFAMCLAMCTYDKRNHKDITNE